MAFLLNAFVSAPETIFATEVLVFVIAQHAIVFSHSDAIKVTIFSTPYHFCNQGKLNDRQQT